VETGFLARLAQRGRERVLARLDEAFREVPVAIGPQQQEARSVARVADDDDAGGKAGGAQALAAQNKRSSGASRTLPLPEFRTCLLRSAGPALSAGARTALPPAEAGAALTTARSGRAALTAGAAGAALTAAA